MRVGSVFGLGLAYANSKRETVTKNEEGGVIFELKKVSFCFSLFLFLNRPSTSVFCRLSWTRKRRLLTRFEGCVDCHLVSFTLQSCITLLRHNVCKS